MTPAGAISSPADAWHRQRLRKSIKKQCYEEAYDLLFKVKVLRDRTGQADRFNTWLDGIRRTYKAKRTFIKMLNESK